MVSRRASVTIATIGEGSQGGGSSMNRWLTPVLGMFILFGALSPVWANFARPPQPLPLPEAKPAKLVVVIDERVAKPRLIIPKTLMGEKKSASLDTTTIIAGLALSLAFISGGVWLSRRGKARSVAAAVLSLSALTFGATTLFAQNINGNYNFNNGGQTRPAIVTPVMLPATLVVTEKIQVEYVEQGDEIKLLVSKDMVKNEAKSEPKSNQEKKE
jgi:hypothetical protein